MLNRPISAGFIVRRRLWQAVDEALVAGVAILDAPWGAGKSTLLYGWAFLHSAPEPASWVFVHDGARTADGFVALLRAVLQRRGLLADEVGPIRLTDGGTRARIIVDNAQALSEPAQEWLAGLVQRHPRARFVIATRSVTRIRTLLEALEGSARIVQADLSFTLEEVAESAVASGLELSAPALRNLHERSGGRALEVRLLLTAAMADDTVRDASERVQARAGEVMLLGLAPEERRFVLMLSVLGLVDAELARAIAGAGSAVAGAGSGPAGAESGSADEDTAPRLSEWQARLVALGHAGLGVFVFREVFLLPAHVLVALRAVAKEELTAAERRAARIAAADVLMTRESWGTAALRLYVRANAVDRIVPLIFQRTAELLDPESRTEAVLRRLGEETIAATPTLAITLAGVRVPREPVPSALTIRRIRAALSKIDGRPASDPAEEFERAVLRFIGLRILRRFKEANAEGENMIDAAQRLGVGSYQLRSGLFTRFVVELALSHLLDGSLERALSLVDLIEDAPDSAEHRRELRAAVHAIRGDHRIVPAPEPAPGERPRLLMPTVISCAWAALERGTPGAAIAQLRAVEAVIAAKDTWPYALEVLAQAHLAQDPHVGRDELDRLMSARQDRPASARTLALLHAAMADLAMATGDFDAARAILSDRDGTDPVVQLSRARLALLLGAGRAPEELRQLVARPRQWPRHRANALMLLAVFAERDGDAPEAERSLRRVIALAERTGLRTPFMMVPAGELRAIAGRAGIRLPDDVPDPFQTVLPVVSLTVRERVVLAELGTGAAIASIAERLHVSTSTVKSQAASIYRKLGVATRADATARARQRGLLDG